MFTGLVQGKGTINSLDNDLYAIRINQEFEENIYKTLAIGDSVAVDGVCLTVEKLILGGFVATASPETLSRTTLGSAIKKQQVVNLETSLRLNSKIGGHFVTGHVDGVGCLVESVNKDKSWEMVFSSPKGLEDSWMSYIAPYVVSKGSIAVNGVSLTVASCDSQNGWFKVAVIPHTYWETNLSGLRSQDLVNLECDILAKYVDKLINHRGEKSVMAEEIDFDFLRLHGY